MSRDERAIIPHHRPSGQLAAATPSQRVAELSLHINAQDGVIAALQAKVDLLQKDYDRYHSFSGTSFGGVTMAQYWCDLVLWEAILNTNHDEVSGIIEIGTWKGGFSLWLNAQAQARGMSFVTYDAVVPTDPFGVVLQIPGFVHLDVFAHPEIVAADMGGHLRNVILLCDGGNKPREVSMFSQYLRPKDLLVVHDWGNEMLQSDVPDTLETMYGDYCDDLGSVSRVFRVKQ